MQPPPGGTISSITADRDRLAETSSAQSPWIPDLLQSEIAEKQARFIRYQLSIAKLPLAKDIDELRLHRYAGQ